MDDRDRERRESMVWPTQVRNGCGHRPDFPERRGTMVPCDDPNVARDRAQSRARPEMDGPHARA
jgi:hypothetical protein